MIEHNYYQLVEIELCADISIVKGSQHNDLFNEDGTTQSDYTHLKDTYRPSHADYVYQQKYGIRDYKGGGRSSARETVNWVVAGAVAKQLISTINITSFYSRF